MRKRKEKDNGSHDNEKNVFVAMGPRVCILKACLYVPSSI